MLLLKVTKTITTTSGPFQTSQIKSKAWLGGTWGSRVLHSSYQKTDMRH
jgi:hypothetical protein